MGNYQLLLETDPTDLRIGIEMEQMKHQVENPWPKPFSEDEVRQWPEGYRRIAIDICKLIEGEK
ncbi:MAG: hypothetical protein M3P98_03010 [bacterium]|nr:hypothetical protein [bacterium]